MLGFTNGRIGDHNRLRDYYADPIASKTINHANPEPQRGITLNAALWILCRRRHNIHRTKHPSRLDRDFGRKSWGDEGYAREELVAELGSAFLCADLEITPEVQEEHASYIATWLQVLKNDNRAIFQAAAFAQRAVDYLHGLQPNQAGAAA